MLRASLRFCFTTFTPKYELLLTAIQYVPKYGWNDRAIHAACAVNDLSPAAHRLITPYDMITHCMQQWNETSLKKIDDSNFEGKKRIREKIGLAIKVRLQQEEPYIDTWAEAMRIGAEPENISKTKDLLWSYSDQIWRRCGDKSTDYNYYSKRILFNAAYAATELHLLTDQSPQRKATWQFLERRLDNIEEAGRGISDVKVIAEAVGSGVLSLFNMFKTPAFTHTPIQPLQAQFKQQEAKISEPKPIDPTSTETKQDLKGADGRIGA